MEALETVGYRLMTSNGTPLVGAFFDRPVENFPLDQHQEAVLRTEAEKALAAKDEEIADLKITNAALMGERDGWCDAVARYHKDVEFYRDLIRDMGRAIGPAAYTSDDGSVQGEPLALKVQEIVCKVYAPRQRLRRALRMLASGY